MSETLPVAARARLSIGALSRASGVPVETLRTWELRFGFPQPERQPSGQRLYALAAVPRLRRIAEALTRGHRAGQVVGASDAELLTLLGAAAPSSSADPIVGILELAESFDGPRLTARLLAEWARGAPLDFLEHCAGPLMREVGEAWMTGRLHVRHEHFISECLCDLLRSVRQPFEQRARGALCVLTTLPGEEHGVGLQMAAVALAWGGCRVLCLGTQTPIEELAQLARDVEAQAIALSVSRASAGPQSEAAIGVLRQRLPPGTALLVGGTGAGPGGEGVEVLPNLRALADWARRRSL